MLERRKEKRRITSSKVDRLSYTGDEYIVEKFERLGIDHRGETSIYVVIRSKKT